MNGRLETRHRLWASLEEGQRRADSSGGEQIVALRLALDGPDAGGDLLSIFDGFDGSERFFWEHPSKSHSMVALGAVRAIEVAGSGRFAEADRLARGLYAALLVGGDRAVPGAGPLLVGGFAFADAGSSSPEWRRFPAGRLVLPELLLGRRAGRTWCTLCRVLSPGGDLEAEWRALVGGFERALSPQVRDPSSDLEDVAGSDACWVATAVPSPGPEYCVRADRSHSHYRAQVRAAIGAIAAGELEKVVLARSLSVRHDGRFALAPFLDSLRRIYPSCVSFAVSRGGDSFVGATPESLISLKGDRVAACALAGSAPRGRSPEEDEVLGRRLCESKKEQAEHAVVVRVIRSVLAPFCDALEAAEAPSLMRVEGIAHLRTPVTGRLRRARVERPSLLDLVAALHPTPAVAGAPRSEALAWIERFEGMQRGWYAGPVGYLDADGDGEFRVALRSGLIVGGAEGDRAQLFAGAGIVADSDPEAELRETRLKLRALLAPLTEI
jgi:isochorismate synthase